MDTSLQEFGKARWWSRRQGAYTGSVKPLSGQGKNGGQEDKGKARNSILIAGVLKAGNFVNNLSVFTD